MPGCNLAGQIDALAKGCSQGAPGDSDLGYQMKAKTTHDDPIFFKGHRFERSKKLVYN